MRVRVLQPATVLSVVALLFSLGGVGYAAGVLPRGSVGTAQLRNNAVVSSKVRNGSLLAADFAHGQLLPGPAGPAGPQGTQGPQGLPGEPATKLWAVVGSTGKVLASSGSASVTLKSGSPYLVAFGRDVTQCAVVATPGAPNPQVIVTAFATSVGVEVHIASRSTGALVHDGFSLALFC